ncbi:hypothetical protein G6F57_015537 [Rhizopus arrhizus]|nr:hypothetical protein G6F57_015537 [Rhizopus arrhizus]
MSSNPVPSNERAAWDALLVDIVDYVRDARIDSPLAFQTAHHCLLDTLGCGLEALSFPACSKLLGPLVPGISVVNGARVPGTALVDQFYGDVQKMGGGRWDTSSLVKRLRD